MELTDAHCHLQDPAFAEDLEEVLARSRAAGVTRWVVNGTRPSDWSRVAALAERIPGVLPQFGLHPWHADEVGDWEGLLEDFLRRFPAAGVGEIGLDARLTPLPLDTQLPVFVRQLRLARRLQRTCTIHAVSVWPLLAETLRRERPDAFLLHAFSGGPAQVAEFAALGAHFSFGGAVLRRSPSLDSLRAVPEDRLHFETDSPFQHPQGARHRMEPSLLPRIADAARSARLPGGKGDLPRVGR